MMLALAVAGVMRHLLVTPLALRGSLI
jgi:hypothetical protein